MTRTDFCVAGSRMLRDDCQTALNQVSIAVCTAIDAAIKAQTAADPVSELVTRRLVEQLQTAYGTAVQLHSARNANYLNQQ